MGQFNNVLKDKIDLVFERKTYRLNTDKIKTLEDVKEVLDGLNISITIQNGITSHKGYDFDKLLKYMD